MPTPTKPYEACSTSSAEPIFGVSGPGNGLGYYAWYGYPENTFPTYDEAEKAARMMNIAFNAGLVTRSRQIKELLG